MSDSKNEDIKVNTVPKKEHKKIIPQELYYRLDIYTPNGTVKQGISAGILYDMASKYGDIIKTIPSAGWLTREGIIQNYWEKEKKLRFEMNRSRQQIEVALDALIEAGLIETRA